MTHIVAVCGMMGSGKSTVLKHFHDNVPGCVVIEEDDYNAAPLRSLDDLRGWWKRGGRVDEFDLTHLSTELEAVRDSDHELVILETQFGRAHPQVRPWIDVQFWIEVDPDIAFARKVAQLAREQIDSAEQSSPTDSLRWIADFCDSYIQVTRPLFQRQKTQVGGLSDERIDGTGDAASVFQRLQTSLQI